MVSSVLPKEHALIDISGHGRQGMHGDAVRYGAPLLAGTIFSTVLDSWRMHQTMPCLILAAVCSLALVLQPRI